MLVSLVGFGILGFKLDELLTYRAANKLAIDEYIFEPNPSKSTFNWLLQDNDLIKQLIKKKNVDLSKVDSDGETLLQKAVKKSFFQKITLLWDKTENNDKVEIFRNCLKLSQFNSDGFGFGKEYEKLNFFLDNKMINPTLFSGNQKYLYCGVTSTKDQKPSLYDDLLHLLPKYANSVEKEKLLSKFIELGFNNPSIYKLLNTRVEDLGRRIFGEETILQEAIRNSRFEIKKGSWFEPDSLCNCFEPISFLWNMTEDHMKAETFIFCVNLRDFSLRNAYIDFFLKNNMISSIIFTEDQKSWLFDNLINRSGKLRLLTKFIDLDFDIDKMILEDKVSIRDSISYDIFHLAIHQDYADNADNIIIKWGAQSSLEFLHAYIEKNIRNSSNNDDCINHNNALKAICELQDLIRTKNIFSSKQLEPISSYLSCISGMLTKAEKLDNAEFGSILWDKANDKRKKFSITQCLKYHENSKLLSFLIENKKIAADLFTEKEQYDMFYTNFLFKKPPEFINKLIKIGFNIHARKHETKNKDIRQIILKDKKIYDPFPEEKFYDKKNYLENCLKYVDKAIARKAWPLLECGRLSENSDLNVFPQDIIKIIVNSML